MQFEIVRTSRFVRVTVQGPADVVSMVRMLRAVATQTREQGDRLVMLDLMQVQESMDATAHFVLGEQVAALLAHLQRLASVVPAHRMTRTSERAARAHGIELRVFNGEGPALDWLLAATSPALAGSGARDDSGMDAVRAAFWGAFRHLFPPSAQAVQLDNGNLVIGWPLSNDPDAVFEMSTPITVRFEPALIDQMTQAGTVQRARMAAGHESAFRAGMLGYNPYADVPQARVIVLG